MQSEKELKPKRKKECVELALKNSDKKLVLDKPVFDALNSDNRLLHVRFPHNLSLHGKGFAWCQVKLNTGHKSITIHRVIAEGWMRSPSTSEVVRFRNGNKLDCRLENMYIATKSETAKK